MKSNTYKSNHLINERSPYLLMHAHNPVNWYPWSEVALNRARAENKLMIISIGYSACHWCHVMEHESFSDHQVAMLMNEHFISIKVDREERPDIDSIYMDAAQLISGRGGWPLNAIALPDGTPVFAATYFTKHQWMKLLEQVWALYEKDSDRMVSQAKDFTKEIQKHNSRFINPDDNSIIEKDTSHQLFSDIIHSVDFEFGGLNSVPKFPMPVVFDFLLQYNHLFNEALALDAVTVTLDRMASGGIYDQIGGGFARYSTDKYWKVPHFEKMLYDNAQLVSLYADAYKITRKEQYAQVIDETLAFIRLEMTSPENGFYSAIDADSENEEGKFYVWGYDELVDLLNDDEAFVPEYFSLDKRGNWEDGKNILHRRVSDETFVIENRLTEKDFKKSIGKVREKLLHYRNKRTRPLTDTKIIASWNGLMIKGYLDAYNATGSEKYLETALGNADFIVEKLISNSTLFRNYKDGARYTNAKLDDYAQVISAFIALYQSTFDESWLAHARKMMENTLVHFYNPETGLFYFTSDQEPGLITRQYEIPDQVIPSSNSVMAMNLYLLGTFFDESRFIKMAEKMLLNIQSNLLSMGIYFTNWAKLQLLISNPPYEIAIVGPNCLALRKQMLSRYFPNIILSGCTNNSELPLLQQKSIANQTSIYICKDKTCSLPVTDLNEALQLINSV
jgi:uncharacterized protein YyaL (SSP411 family)